jgi:hypothetical protein
MRLRFKLTLLLAGLVAALTCDDAPPGLDLAEQLSRAFCAHQLNCCSPFELAGVTGGRYATEPDCVAYATVSMRQQLGTIDGAIDLGRISVDPARAEACVKAFRERACNASMIVFENIGPLPNVAEILAFCPDLLVGHVPMNKACNVTQECARGSRCVGNVPPNNGGFAGSMGAPTTPTTGLGLCVPFQKAGEHCNTSADCDQAARFACQSPQFVCGPAGQVGDPCVVEYDFATGTISSNCDASRRLYCDQFCRRYPTEGEPCDLNRSQLCDPDPALALWCDVRFGAVCKPLGNEGDACGGPAIPPCRHDLACHPQQSDGIGECGSLPMLGEACTDRCASPGVCDAGFCTTPGTLPSGAKCITNSDCASLSCTGFSAGSMFCSPPTISPRCVGSGVTHGVISGLGGQGGFAGSFPTGVGGGFAGGRGPAGTTGAGGGGMGGTSSTPPPLGCAFSVFAPEDPLIADFTDSSVIPIGGTYTYAAPMGGDGPVATMTNGALHITARTTGLEFVQFWGAGIYFNGDLGGNACIAAITHHTGVQFDVSGTIDGPGCTAQYSTNDSAHTNNAVDPKGSGDSSSFAPQASFTVSPTTVTLMFPFSGPGAPTGGNPAIGVDPTKLTGVQWQFTTPAGTENSCVVDITIDNVRFF